MGALGGVTSSYNLIVKRCTKCGEMKPIEAYARTTKSKSGRRAHCKVCQGAYNRAWNLTHRASCNAATRRWRHKNPDAVKAMKQRWNLRRRKGRPRSASELARNRERVKEWRKDNPDLNRALNSLRRAAQRGAAGTGYTTAAHIVARIRFYGGRCYYCQDEATSIDHRIPLSRGGSHWPANLVPACRSCNSRKNTKTESEFRAMNAR